MKMNKLLVSCAIATAMAGGAQAGHGGDYDEDYGNEFADYARVEHVEPIVRSIRVSAPREECYDEQVHYLERPGFLHSNAGLLLGGVAGALLGGEIGHGSGRKLATIGGGLLGASLGHSYQHRYHPPYPREHVSYEERCETIEDVHTEERVEGYDVTYRYQGKRFHTQLPYDPGEELRVGVDVRPLEP
jgi:uncharacterized protein YcfJ